jgi:hypothetical protein
MRYSGSRIVWVLRTILPFLAGWLLAGVAYEIALDSLSDHYYRHRSRRTMVGIVTFVSLAGSVAFPFRLLLAQIDVAMFGCAKSQRSVEVIIGVISFPIFRVLYSGIFVLEAGGAVICASVIALISRVVFSWWRARRPSL